MNIQRLCTITLLSTLVTSGEAKMSNQTENPYAMPGYVREIELEFKTPADAEKAELKGSELPEGKKLAFSLRWDDTNTKHIRQLHAFEPYGFKGNFYLCHQTPASFREMLEKKSAFGSHTLDHPYMLFQDMNECFRQIMEMRLKTETTYGVCVNSFVMPCGIGYGYASLPAGKKINAILGRCLQRSGHLGSPEPYPDVADRLSIPADRWFGSYAFSIGDSNPDPVLFQTRLKERLELIQQGKSPFGPYITLGIHSWQSEEGFRRLEKEVYGKYGNNPEWWYCTANEYYAYRYQYLYTRAEKLSVSGNKAKFRISGPAAPELGSSVPLTFLCNAEIENVSAGKVPAEFHGKYVSIGHDPEHELPVLFDRVRNGTAEKAELGVVMLYDKEKNVMKVQLENKSGKPVENLSLILRLPPCFEQEDGILRKQIASLAPGKTAEILFTPGPGSEKLLFTDGSAYFYLQADFRKNGKGIRVHASTVLKRKKQKTSFPRDNALVLGPLPEKYAFPEKFGETYSVPGTPLKNPGRLPARKWHKITKPGLGLIGVDPSISSGLPDTGWVMTVYVFEFRAEKAETVRLFRWRNSGRFFLNGEELANDEKAIFLTGRCVKGVNRALFMIPTPAWNMGSLIAVTPAEDPLEGFPCLPIAEK